MINPSPRWNHPSVSDRTRPASRRGGFTLIELMVVLAVLGILSTVAWTSLRGSMASTRSAEAVTNVGRLFNAVVMRAQTDHPVCGVDVLGPTPSLAVQCAAGPGGKCNPSGQPNAPGDYALAEWDAWADFGVEQPHHYHYLLRTKKVEGGCKFTAAAFGDLDDDGLFSTFERAGAASSHGVTASPGLYIDQRTE